MTFPLGAHAVHLCIDMQRMFDEATEWHTPGLRAILPNVLRLAEAMADRTLFARFTVPDRPEDAQGSWQDYFRRWESLTGRRMEAGMVEVVAPLASLASPGRTADKPTYSLFAVPGTDARLRAMGADTLLFSGVETDVCVLASLFGAVDLGYRTIIVRDAVASASSASHAAVLDLLLPRLPEQVRIASTEEILSELAA